MNDFKFYSQIHALEVKVIELHDSSVIDVRGTLMKKQEIEIADKSGVINMTIWKDMVDQFHADQTIRLTDLSVRIYAGNKTLTTTASSKFTCIEDIGCVKTNPTAQHKDATIAIGKIEQIVVHSNYQCLSCNKKLHDINTDTKYIRCQHCQMKQLFTALSKSFYANCNFKSEGHVEKLTIFSSVLTTFLTHCNKTNLLNDMDELEEFLLQIDALHMQYSNNKVVKTMRIVSQTFPPPMVAQTNPAPIAESKDE